jgi:hypothetical protein
MSWRVAHMMFSGFVLFPILSLYEVAHSSICIASFGQRGSQTVAKKAVHPRKCVTREEMLRNTVFKVFLT